MSDLKIIPGRQYTPEQLREIEAYLAGYEADDRIVTFKEKKSDVDALGQEYALHSTILFPQLSREIAGFSEGELVMVSGPTAGGKTLFLQSLHHEFAMIGPAPVWFSYEVCPRLFFQRFGEGNPPPGYLPREMSANTLPWLYQRIWEAKVKHDCRLVMIDHLHYIIDMAQLHNPSLQIGAIVRGLKRMAVEMGMIIFLIQHMREIEPDDEPSMRHIRDTGMAIREADTVIMVWRLNEDEHGPGRAMLKIDKARRTGVLARRIPVIKKHAWLEETDDRRGGDNERNWQQ